MSYLSNPELIHRPDGAIWHSYKGDECEVILTSRGRELFGAKPELEERAHLYIQRALGRTTAAASDLRVFFAEGSNSRVYTFAPGLLIKETMGHSMELALQRMDNITTVMEHGMPRWLNMAVHYGMLRSPRLPNQYVLMEQIDSGVHVGHLTRHEEYSELERRGVALMFGPVTSDERREIADSYAEAEKILHQGLADHNFVPPTSYLSDWHDENVLVQRLETPVAGKNFGLWVIDQ